ncbi:MAG: DNA polymerase III subunits gamma and tau [Candidatus Jettenia ecosi]|uniref:DNA polymerase III subunits gamma and tau n=1 Tax=Candidatus Jettenia ecosi TaxID=2494326 RepID=A0A533QDA7_9BACT|nr:MAG: DNA polymerase III subunits gamma and tau [Candidatus Jettenia ecosi]
MRLKLALAKNIHPEKNKTNLSSDHGPSNQIAVNPVCSEPVVNKIVELFDGHVMKVNK